MLLSHVHLDSIMNKYSVIKSVIKELIVSIDKKVFEAFGYTV